MAPNIYDRIAALPRGDARREEIAHALGCHHLATAMLRILNIEHPEERDRVSEMVLAILDRPERMKRMSRDNH